MSGRAGTDTGADGFAAPEGTTAESETAGAVTVTVAPVDESPLHPATPNATATAAATQNKDRVRIVFPSRTGARSTRRGHIRTARTDPTTAMPR
ncbi:hypothetical protein EBN03_05355 [Nocardia stercoris]|uniref:Uncharacterized protein n=1 Tax=Nocardia stercoris TaxID=2483361 RepID=A0A3M2LGC9_9NOCA|nr:hypothetical protein EBN03_05355 [Nocardia stercoris]